jgi:ribosomal protein L16 Arg81 hydroxylase
LRAFNFAPRWLMDEIMVSFSNKGGTIGGHVDSYHVFLVQGQGSRHWNIGRDCKIIGPQLASGERPPIKEICANSLPAKRLQPVAQR